MLCDGAIYTQAEYPQGFTFALDEMLAGSVLWSADTVNRRFIVPNLVGRFIFDGGVRRRTRGSGRRARAHADA